MSKQRLNKYFTRSEFGCACGCGQDTVDAQLLVVLTAVREHFGRAVIITSGFRCIDHNLQIGGALDSQHTRGKAADFGVNGVHTDRVADYLEHEYYRRFGIGRYKGRTHIDVRDKPARWDNR